MPARANRPETDPVASADLAAAVATLNAGLAGKQASATAATDAELAAAVASLQSAIAAKQDAAGAATDAELTAAVADLSAAVAAKQDAAGAATDADLDAALAPTLDLHALEQRCGARFRRSAAAHRTAYEDTTVWTDQFSNLSGWTVFGGSALQVSGNRVYFSSGAFAPGTSSRFRLVGRIKYVAGGAGHQTHIGVLVGSDPSVLGNITSIMVTESGQVLPFYGGSAQASLGTVPSAGDYIVTITADENVVSFEIAAPDRSFATGYTRTRAQAGNIANALIVVNDARGTSGSGVGPIGARSGSMATIAPRTNIEGVAYTGIRTPAATGSRIELPPGYDSRVPAPLFLGTHGYTGDQYEGAPNGTTGSLANARAMFKAVLDKGFVVAMTDGGGDYPGAAVAQTALADLLDWCLANLAISGVVLFGISAGGVAVQNAITRRALPAAGLVLLQSTPDLPGIGTRSQAIGGQTAADFRAVYGIAADYSDAAAKLAPWNPIAESAPAWRGVPILATNAASDTAAPLSEMAALSAKLSDYNPFTQITGSGAHGDASLFPASAVADFAEECVA